MLEPKIMSTLVGWQGEELRGTLSKSLLEVLLLYWNTDQYFLKFKSRIKLFLQRQTTTDIIPSELPTDIPSDITN